MPKIDLIACNRDQSRTVHIQVKAKSGDVHGTQVLLVANLRARQRTRLTKYFTGFFVDLGQKENAAAILDSP